MKKMLVVAAILMSIMCSSALALNNVVVVPLGGAKNYMYWQGDWSAGTAYKVGDAVHMDGSSFMCLTKHTSSLGSSPPNASYWALIAAKGAQGETGEAGPQGPEGPQGVQGEQGVKGDQGLKGDTGDIGPIGPKGDTGDQGIQGIQGEPGSKGDKGDKGDPGAAGTNGLNCWDSNGNDTCDLAAEDKTLDGICDTNDCQGLKGEQGLQGDKGDQGLQGDKGDPGPQGEQGLQGIQGIQGEQGLQGIQGIQGEQGLQGDKGDQGVAGSDGLNCWDLNGNGNCDVATEDKDSSGTCDAKDCQGISSVKGSVFRWQVFETYINAEGVWVMGNNPLLHGGVAPSTWTDGGAVASQMSRESEYLRTLLTRKGYGGTNAMVYSETYPMFSSTNGRVLVVLFRIKNTTSGGINWQPSLYFTCFAGWGEIASASINGTSAWAASSCSGSVNLTSTVTFTLPANSTSTIIFVSTSSAPYAVGSLYLRYLNMTFFNNSLNLPNGLEYVDDLDSVTGQLW